MKHAIALLLAGCSTIGAAQYEPPPVRVARLDEVGMAGRTSATADLFVVHRSLSVGSSAEVTALDTGRTIVLPVRAGALAPDRVADLSPAAAAALQLPGMPLVAVRVRPAITSPQEQATLRGGGTVMRLDAPPALLVALRRKLPNVRQPSPEVPREIVTHSVRPPAAKPKPTVTVAPKTAPAPTQMAKPKPAPAAPTGRWFVQVATLSDAARAQQLAKSVGGVVRRASALYRVQAGPYATRIAADRARADIARRGFGDARTIALD
jgi:rare lipoprotein A